MSKNPVKLPGLNHRLVLEFDRPRARELLLVVALSVVMLLPLLTYVWQNVEWIQVGYRLEELKSQQERLVEMQYRLRLEKASLESLARVEHVGARQLGLAQPPDGTVRLRYSTSAGSSTGSSGTIAAARRDEKYRRTGIDAPDHATN